MLDRRLFVLAFLGLVSPCFGAVDLGIRFISRSPLYWRYNVVYPNGLPTLAPTHDDQDPTLDQHWPKPGEGVTFTAHIRNNGDVAVSGFGYRWSIDGAAVGPLTYYPGSVQPGAETTVSLKWAWPADLSDHTVRLVVDPNDAIGDAFRQNNAYTDHTNALSFSIWVEQKLFEKFNAQKNGFGTYSFDDWFRWQFDKMKEMFRRSRYAVVAPNGILERIRLEEINVVPYDPNDLNNWRTAMANDPHLMLNDGRWQFTSDRGTLAEKEADWTNYVSVFIDQIDWGLIHEMSHQLGIIDEYRMNLEISQNQATWANGTPIGSRHIFHLGGLMGGGYVKPRYDGTYFDSHTAGYMNRNLHYRRGFYGDYLFDTPSLNVIRVHDISGAPLADASVFFYQKDPYSEVLSSNYTFMGKTDANGLLSLPNRLTPTVTTATGHRLRRNPFGQINVVGTNGTMLLRIKKGRQEDARWFEIIQLNLAFWMGNASAATYDFYTDIVPGAVHVGKANVAFGKPATASSNALLAPNANNGDLSDPALTWVPEPTTQGQWWQVDLGANHRLCRAIVYPYAGNYHDWYGKFHFEISKTGAFSGEQVVVPAEKNLDETRDCGDYGMQRLSGLINRGVYTFPPRVGRYFRIVSDVDQNWVQLQELELYDLVPN